MLRRFICGGDEKAFQNMFICGGGMMQHFR